MDKESGNEKKQDTDQQKNSPVNYNIVQAGNAERKIDSENPSVYFSSPVKKKGRKKTFMPIMITMSSAALIGIVFGVIMLQMFVTLNEPSGSESKVSQTSSAVSEAEKNGNKFPELSAYMLQAGVFSQRENAENWMKLYQGENLPVIVWEREEHYYLFTGVYMQEEEAKQRAVELQAKGFDVFVKPWSTSEAELTLTNDEAKWLNDFQTTWTEAIAEKNTDSLKSLLLSRPENDIFNNLFNELEKDKVTGDEQFYLDLMYTYEQLANYM